MVAQDQAEVTLHRRANGWKPELISGAGSGLELRSPEFSLPFDAIFEEGRFKCGRGNTASGVATLSIEFRKHEAENRRRPDGKAFVGGLA